MKAKLHVPGLAVVAMLAHVAGLQAVELPMTSPFLPATGVPAAAAAALDTGGIELHGVLSTPLGPMFSIYNTSRRKSVWVGLNETGTWGGAASGSFVVRSYRQMGDLDQVTVDYQGRSTTLVTKKPKVGIPSRGGSNPAASANGAPMALTQTVSLNPTPESEALRLQAVTDELARRRADRALSDAAAATAPAAPPASAAPPPPVRGGTP